MFLQATLMKLTGRHIRTQAHTQKYLERGEVHLPLDRGTKKVMGGEYDQNIYTYEMS